MSRGCYGLKRFVLRVFFISIKRPIFLKKIISSISCCILSKLKFSSWAYRMIVTHFDSPSGSMPVTRNTLNKI